MTTAHPTFSELISAIVATSNARMEAAARREYVPPDDGPDSLENQLIALIDARIREALEKECETCKGTGRWLDPGTGKHVTCHDCEGRGFVPTEHGEQVLAFLRRYLK